MKKIAILLIFAALLGCEKDEFYLPDQYQDDIDGYVWPGVANPRPVEDLGRTAVSGWSNVYDYNFRIHLDGSQIDPVPLDIESFAIPHVGPEGTTIYENVNNDATYTISSIENGYIYYTIRSEEGHTLKYNLARRSGQNWIWFLRHGLTNDNGQDNMISFQTY
jgi:hypothetical protein